MYASCSSHHILWTWLSGTPSWQASYFQNKWSCLPVIMNGPVSGNCNPWAVPQSQTALLWAVAAQLGILQMKIVPCKIFGVLKLALFAMCTALIVFQRQLKNIKLFKQLFIWQTCKWRINMPHETLRYKSFVFISTALPKCLERLLPEHWSTPLICIYNLKSL